MSLNSSFGGFSFVNSPLPPPECYSSSVSIFILTAFSLVNVLLFLPLFVFILCLGCQHRRRRQRSSSCHSDVFVYHMVTMEIIAVLECVLYCFAAYLHHLSTMFFSLELFSSTWSVKIQFHMLTCVEHYLAVVHPITYMTQRSSDGGLRVRNVGVGSVWLLWLLWGISLPFTSNRTTMILYFCLVAVALIVVSYCCIAALCALKRPSPGEVGGARDRVDQSKQKAFHSIVIIMVVLWVCLGAMLGCDALEASALLSDTASCAVITSSVWFSMPSSLVLPLLYLQRAGKLPGSRQTPPHSQTNRA